MQDNRAVIITATDFVPASPLDNVLHIRAAPSPVVTFFDFLTGEPLDTNNRPNFYRVIIKNAHEKVYPTTDHLITDVEVGGFHFLYVSLDNSARSNANGHPLYKRLGAICRVLNQILDSLGGKCIVFFSESCRPSFSGDVDHKENLTSWISMRRTIEETCDLRFLIEKRNNDDASDMSFGLSVFYTSVTANVIATYFTRNILSEGFGSAAVGIKLITGEMVWGIHFPLDFKGQGTDNLGHKTMVNLQKLMLEYPGSVCAFGDFNTIPGAITETIRQAIQPEFEFVLDHTLTFFGAYYDTVPLAREEGKVVALDA